MSNPVLVTGGAGYIGSHVVWALLDSGRDVVVVDDLSAGDREAVPGSVAFHQLDVGDTAGVARVLREHRIGSVMHFAGSIIVPESIADPVRYYRNNTARSLELLGACLEAGVQGFVFSSTAAVYGLSEAGLVGEEAAIAPISPYGASKWMTERMLEDVGVAHPSFRSIRLRYFNVAGADPQGRTGQRGPQATHLIRAAADTALGRRPHLEIFGTDYPTRDGTCVRDFIHVSDLADAHLAALAHLEQGGTGGVFNCGYGRGASVLDVVAAFEQELGRELPIRHAPRRPGDPPRLVSRPDRLKQELGWSPRHAELSEIVGSALRWEATRQT